MPGFSQLSEAVCETFLNVCKYASFYGREVEGQIGSFPAKTSRLIKKGCLLLLRGRL